jgi:methionyl-tRNA formyltransferase
VRYFNEFLWFYRESNIDRPLMEGCLDRFSSNLNEKGNHRLPDQLNQYPVDITGCDLSKSYSKAHLPLRVCLIGFPVFFGPIIKKLKKEGHHVEQFFLPYHPALRINRLLKFRIPVKVLSLLFGNFYPYRTLNFDYKDDRIGQILREGNFDIGFHKLNFIIKNNIFGAFKIGLLNDHWGYLPLLRGKSTIAYSLLLNIPAIPTMHFINKGIDSGPIAGFYPCDYSKAKSVKEIRQIFRKTMPERAVAAINHSSKGDFTPKENKKEAGITFYEIHPWLSNHIASHLFNR